jgi:stage V sporulation protein SpoVS
LDHLLDQYPRRLTLQELSREVGALRDDAVQRAVDNLAAAHFVRREGAVLTAAPAVVNFDRQPIATEF